MLMATLASAQVDNAWPDPVANDVIPYGVCGLTHGPVLGAITSTSVRVWVRTEQPMPFRIVYGPALPLDASSSGLEGQTRPKWYKLDGLLNCK